MMDWKEFFNDFADRYYSVPDFTNKEHVYALQNYLIEQGMLVEDVDYAIKTLLGEAPDKPTNPKIAKQAKDMGLVWKGKGYGPENVNKVTHKVDDDKLVPVDDEEPKDDKEKKDKDDDRPINLSKGDKVDAQLGGDRDAGPMDMMDKDDVGKIKKDEEPKKQKTKDKKSTEKNKKLNQKKTKQTTKEFNEGSLAEDGVSDEDYLEKHRDNLVTNAIELEDVEKLFPNPTPFPKKYLKVLQRLLNTKKPLKITDVTDSAGGGTPDSTTGELITMMVTSIDDDEQAEKTLKALEEHVNKNGGSKSETLVALGWIKSARNVRKTIRSRYDRLFGKGNWKFKNAAWDIKEEVETLGMEEYSKNKGFSTDVYFSVETGGETLIDEVSLKKNKLANLLNTTTGRVTDILIRAKATDEEMEIYQKVARKKKVDRTDKEQEFLDKLEEKYAGDMPDEINVEKVKKRQKELHENSLRENSEEIRSVLSNFNNLSEAERLEKLTEIGKAMNQKPSWAKATLEEFSKIASTLPTDGEITTDMLKDILGTGKLDRIQKLSMMLHTLTKLENPNGKSAKALEEIIQNSRNHSKAVADYLLSNDEAKAGLLKSIREDFPLAALMSGEENMVLDDLSMDQQTLFDITGATSMDEVQENLSIRDEPPPPSIVYTIEGQQEIPIAEVRSRPDGIGYGGNWKLEMKLHPDMAKELEASKKAER